jgi:uncharacterized membrane protein YkvA (DUF1232 family)
MLETWKDRARTIRREAHALYLAARHPWTPWSAKLLALLIAAYALSPIDLIPDFIPVLGLLDEIVLLPIAVAGVIKLIPADVMAECRIEAARAAVRPTSTVAAATVIAIWLAVASGAAWLAYRWHQG